MIMSTKDLYKLAQESGMTDEEFVKEVRECFATHMSLILDGMKPGMVYGHSFLFIDHTIVIECRKVKKNNLTIN